MFIIVYVVLTIALAVPLVGVRLLAAHENRASESDAGTEKSSTTLMVARGPTSSLR